MKEVLDSMNKKAPISLVIEGEQRGADTSGKLWAETVKVKVEPHPANWAKYGRAAGPIRNREMLKSNPDLVVAFHDNILKSKGTADMLKAAKAAKIKCLLITTNEISILGGV